MLQSEMPQKVLHVRPDGSVMAVSGVLEKAYEPIEVTELPMVTDVRKELGHGT